LQIGNKSALNAFLAQYPDGFYASLAKLQLDKLSAEDARVAATEKARQAEHERARLAAEGAQRAQQAKAEADARAAEQARVAAEKAKQAAQEQAAAAEQKRVAAETAAAADKAPAPAPAPAADKPVNVAALTPAAQQPDVSKSVQSELRRVGCLTSNADGNWNNASQRSLSQFNRYAGTKLDPKVASLDTLDTIKLKSNRVCPLTCEHGFKAEGERCTKIVCAEGSFLNDDNECEKRREKKPVAKRERQEKQERPAPEARQGRAPVAGAAPYGQQAVAGRRNSHDPSIGANGRPLTGLERQQGCNGYQAIMSGVCP
jgi:hypothetical protein